MTPKGRKKRWLDEVAPAWGSDECLLFPFPLDKRGYGNFQDANRQTYMAHIYICEIVHGSRPSPEFEVAHSCGRGACVNKRHLRWATSSENEADKLLHGTHNRGERQGAARLTARQVLAIRAAIIGGAVQRHLASQYGVSEQTICEIKHRRRWSWL